MVDLIRRVASIAAVCAGCSVLSGCLITGFSSSKVGDLTMATANVTLQRQASCTVDVLAPSTTCTPVMTIGIPGGPQQVYNFSITLLGYAAPVPFYDPVIVQVPLTMSDFAGSIAVGPPGVAPNTPLLITAGLTSIPIDATTNLVAEPGMQLVIIDFIAPANAPFGQYTLNFQFRGTTNSIKIIFAGKVTVGVNAVDAAAEKAAVTYYPPIYPCVTSMAQVPAIALPVANIAQLVNIVLAAQGCVGKVYNLAAAAGPTVVDVIEFYNAVLDHYFITWIAAEIANLDAGLTPTKWNRTGQKFKAHTSALVSTTDICRYYIPPGLGDSHFFGRGTAECNATGQAHPTFVLEDPTFMRLFLPNLGNCPANTTPIYRVFSNRLDANHRYMTDRAIRTQMVAAGWLAEGDGPDLVVMCAPA